MTKKQTTPLATPLPGTLTLNKFWLKTGMQFETPTRVCNAASTKPLVLDHRAPARPGAEQFRQYHSRGLGC